MPDTAANQKTYPQTWNQKRGAGLPLTRVAAIFSLSCGAILNLKIAKYSGKGQGEVTLLHEMSDLFSRGDMLLADALMCNWKVLYSFTQRGVDVVTRINKAHRKADFRKGKRLGKDDHLVDWPKPFIRNIDRELQLIELAAKGPPADGKDSAAKCGEPEDLFPQNIEPSAFQEDRHRDLEVVM